MKIFLICCMVSIQMSAMAQGMSIQKQFYEIAAKYQSDQHIIAQHWLEIDSIYREERRAYHNMEHLENFHHQLQKCRTLLSDYETLFMAMVYHDIVYFTPDGTNEEKSAELAQQRLAQLNFPAEKIEKCLLLILATKGHAKSADLETNYFLDADLSILGLSNDQYDAYTKGIISEYGGGTQFLSGRKRFLERFLLKERIFHTDFFYNLYEEAARENIKREIEGIM